MPDLTEETEFANDLDSNYKFPFSPLLLIETLSRKSFSYGKLPLEPIRLTVLKLDGSSFDISVAKKPTVAQLKQAVEDAFNHLPKHGVGKVSWSHVWAQFCLSFNGQKLLNDQDSVAIHGIKDGDQAPICHNIYSGKLVSFKSRTLQFARHTSISYNLVKERPEKRDHHLEESSLSPNKQEVQRQEGGNDLQDNSNQQNKEDKNETDSSDDIALNITCYCSWAHLWKRLFTYRNQKRHHTNSVDLA